VSRSDYQDISRDLLGLPSVSHQDEPLPGMDVVIGCGWGNEKKDDFEKQGKDFIPGNKFLTAEDLAMIDVENGGQYVVATRTEGEDGSAVLAAAAGKAIKQKKRLFGFFGIGSEHLPYQTADGNYDPTRGIDKADRYTPEDLSENPVLAEMATAALDVLGTNKNGFWLMVEAGDVDWANHNNNIDDAIGAVFSGEKAFDAITNWVEENSSWEDTLLIVTADHGHMMTLDEPEKLIRQKTTEAKPKRLEESVSASK
jgi:alkaline phosphatase